MGVDNFCRYGPSARQRDYTFVEGDLADRGFADSVVRGVEGVIQAAARVYGVGGFHRYPADILANDVTLHQNILWSAKDHGVGKVCYVSSSMIFERCPHHPSREDHAFESLIPSTDYGLSKVVGERLCHAFARQYGLTYVVWRPFNVITPFERGESEPGISHVFADFIRRIVLEGTNPITILGDGRQIRCFTWIEDVAETIATYSFEPTTDNQTYNLGNPEPITMRELARMIHHEARSQSALSSDAKPLQMISHEAFSDDVKTRIPDVTKARRQLGWKPTVKIAEAVRRCVRQALTDAQDAGSNSPLLEVR